MRKNVKLLGAVAVAGLVAATGSAFTATSTIDDAAINVGSVSQSVSGATFTKVVHTYTAATDTTTALSAHAAQELSTATGVVTVFVNASTTANACTVTLAVSPLTGSDVACDIADTVNLTSIRFVVNG